MGWFDDILSRQTEDSFVRNLFGYENNSTGSNRPVIKDTPRTARNPSGLDPQVLAAYNESVDLYNQGKGEQQDIVRGARDDLRTDKGNIQDLFDTRLNEVLATIPKDPFSDEMRNSLEGQAFSEINTQVNRMAGRLGAGLSGRGLSSGGSQAVSAATDLGLGEIGARQTAANQLRKDQMDVNLAQDKFRAGIMAGLTEAEASQLAGLDKVSATMGLAQAGLLNPEYLPNLIGDALSSSIGIEQANELTALLQNAIEANDMDAFNQILTNFLGPLASISGYDRIGVGLQGIGSLG